MEDKLEITIGKGNHSPIEKRNTIPILMELCADARKNECQYYIRVIVETDKLSFNQGFCGWKSRKIGKQHWIP